MGILIQETMTVYKRNKHGKRSHRRKYGGKHRHKRTYGFRRGKKTRW